MEKEKETEDQYVKVSQEQYNEIKKSKIQVEKEKSEEKIGPNEIELKKVAESGETKFITDDRTVKEPTIKSLKERKKAEEEVHVATADPQKKSKYRQKAEEPEKKVKERKEQRQKSLPRQETKHFREERPRSKEKHHYVEKKERYDFDPEKEITKNQYFTKVDYPKHEGEITVIPKETFGALLNKLKKSLESHQRVVVNAYDREIQTLEAVYDRLAQRQLPLYCHYKFSNDIATRSFTHIKTRAKDNKKQIEVPWLHLVISNSPLDPRKPGYRDNIQPSSSYARNKRHAILQASAEHR